MAAVKGGHFCFQEPILHSPRSIAWKGKFKSQPLGSKTERQYKKR